MIKTVCDKCGGDCLTKVTKLTLRYEIPGNAYPRSYTFHYCEECTEATNIQAESIRTETAAERLEALIREIAAEEVEDA